MKSKLPILIIIPHGGRSVPDELSGFEQIDEFGLFIESDAYANEIFNITDTNAKIDTKISRLFVDMDRQPSANTSETDGIIKKESQNGRKIFKENIFPDEISASNILKRHYEPFHNSIRKIITDGGIKLILECHTMMPVGPRRAKDAGMPRPIINIENTIKSETRTIRTCPNELAENFLLTLKKYFNNEDSTVSERFTLNNPPFEGYILNEYGQNKIPMLRVSVSTSLFLNDTYFNYDSLTIDKNRIEDLKKRFMAGCERFSYKFL